MQRHATRPTRARLAVVALLIVTATIFVLPARMAVAQQATILKMTRSIKIDEVGDADVHLTIKVPTNVYTSIKANTPNIAILLRRLGVGQDWSLVHNVRGKFDDMKNSIEIDYRHEGLTRVRQSGAWEMNLDKDVDIDLISNHGNQAVFSATTRTDLGITNLVIRIDTPQGSTALSHDRSKNSFQYTFDPQVAAGERADTRFDVDHKKSLMSCLAKLYSNDKFSNLWVARSKFRNSGDQTLNDYRIRFRVAGHSAWSRWNRTSKVYPGQTVVDPFFPVFDLNKLNELTGSRPAMLEMEYQYRTTDGELVRETDSRRLKLLARNQTVFSSLKPSEAVSFSDLFNNISLVLASFTTPNDPVIQQLAGGISGSAGGAASALRTEDAVKFIKATYEFMSANRIAYQTPPSLRDGELRGQHVKYGRDVLRNKAGTCIDLAILWASTMEAVGLRPVLVVVPGHCFPAVYLPNGQLIAIESTMVGKKSFDEAFKVGMKELAEAQQGTAIFVDIAKMRQLGVQSLDLPKADNNFLSSLGYRFDRQTPSSTVVENRSPQQPRPVSAAQQLVGTWGFNGPVQGGTLKMAVRFEADGTFACYFYAETHDGYSEETKIFGRWSVQGDRIITVTEEGTVEHPFAVQGNACRVYLPSIDMTVALNRMK